VCVCVLRLACSVSRSLSFSLALSPVRSRHVRMLHINARPDNLPHTRTDAPAAALSDAARLWQASMQSPADHVAASSSPPPTLSTASRRQPVPSRRSTWKLKRWKTRFAGKSAGRQCARCEQTCCTRTTRRRRRQRRLLRASSWVRRRSAPTSSCCYLAAAFSQGSDDGV
jgi:hypothetical protein